MKRRFVGLVLCLVAPCVAQRSVVSLNGMWDIADSVAAQPAPTEFTHKAPVPGLAHSATPAFADVDRFDSLELIANRIGRGDMPKSAMVSNAGVPHQDRGYFWYRTTFTAPGRRAVAMLRINKAQFGTAVWVNGKPVGEHLPCFTAAYMDVTGAVRWSGANELLVRVGAHPGVLPSNVSGGTDFEKNRWTPGIYDDVALLLSDNPVIETVQVAPWIRPDTGIAIQTRVKNFGAREVSFRLKEAVREWKGAQTLAQSGTKITLAAGEEKTITEKLAIPHAKLWSPESPNLYMLESSTGGDSTATRFGVREFRFDTATRRAYLNGQPYFLRGSNITLHRFFEDEASGTLPWDEAWVRKVLVDIPKRMHWNSFRFCIGPVPDKWLEIADEAGLLIQNEYFVWIGDSWYGKGYRRTFDANEMIGEYREWMRDNWNHPSVAIWDANNETWYPDFGTQIIPAVRGLDLSNRPWENSYNGPQGPDDPVEDHPYEFQVLHHGPNDAVKDDGAGFRMTDLEERGGAGAVPTGHATILNEYGWLWLNRDGSPTLLTNDVYPKLPWPTATAEQRFEVNAYLLGGITEYWRAFRHYAGVLHFVYLTAADPNGFTCDHFRDVRALKLDPYFEDYLSNAFQPLGVYLNFWHPTLEAGSKQRFRVMMVNDHAQAVSGELSLLLNDAHGETLARTSVPFAIAALGQGTWFVELEVPARAGKGVLQAVARPSSGPQHEAVTSRRWVEVK